MELNYILDCNGLIKENKNWIVGSKIDTVIVYERFSITIKQSACKCPISFSTNAWLVQIAYWESILDRVVDCINGG